MSYGKIETTPLIESIGNSKFKLNDHAILGIATSLGSNFWGMCAIVGSFGSSRSLAYTAAVSSVFSSTTALAGLYVINHTRDKAADYIKWGLTAGFAVGVSTATMVGGAAVPFVFNITEDNLYVATVGTAFGSIISNTMATPAAAILAGYGLFKAHQYLKAKADEPQIEEIRDFAAP